MNMNMTILFLSWLWGNIRFAFEEKNFLLRIVQHRAVSKTTEHVIFSADIIGKVSYQN